MFSRFSFKDLSTNLVLCAYKSLDVDLVQLLYVMLWLFFP